MLRRWGKAGLILVGLAVALMATPALAQQIKWDMANEYGATTYHGDGDQYFSKALKEKSGGRIVITHHFGGSLGFKSKDQFDAVGDGAIPLANSYIGALVGLDPLFLLPSLPFLAHNLKETRILWDVSKPYFDEIMAKNRQKLLYSAPWPQQGIWSKKPVKGKADLRNVKIRCSDLAGITTFKALGATPIQLAWSDVIPQLGTGGLDAVFTSADGGTSAKFWEHVGNFTDIYYALPLNFIHMNLKTYEALSPEQRKAVDEAVKDAEAHVWARPITRVAENYEVMRKNKVNIIEQVSPEFSADLTKAGEVAVNDWLKSAGDRGKNIVAEFKKRAGKN